MMKFNKKIKIGSFEICEDSKVFIIAEAGVNHNGDMKLARGLIDAAVEAGADAVKFQSFSTEHLILKDVTKAPYQKETTDTAESQFDMLKSLEITKEQTKELKGYCDKKGIIFLTTPFDEYSLDELDEIDLPAYKIASTDITNLLFLKRVARKQKPIILSTGMAYLSEVKAGLEEIYNFNKDVILLQCTANYPIEDAEVNLNVIKTYKKEFDMLTGYSDHSTGIGACPLAVALGAKIIEKHFTLDSGFEGPDHRMSLEPEELKQFVIRVRKAEEYLGSMEKSPTPSESQTRKSLQKYLVASKDIKEGDIFSDDNLSAKRTGGAGISPIRYKEIIGQKAKRSYHADEVIDE
ncbi:MAG: N-acetylneuraminate synthase [Sedimentisphaerales bacterium]|nr:N-acetylneuraminate synthase [Sedimentisphaerales bacterium]